MKGYKAFNPGWICRDMQYEIGKVYELPEEQEPIMCERGYHFCKNPIDVFGYYNMTDDTLIAEVEALGEIVQEGTKYCTNKIHIVREFTRKQLQALILDGKYNTGENNTGNCNSGDRNSGNCNSGDCNSGHCNSGNYNSGIFNTYEPPMRAFNKFADITYTDFITSIDYDFYDLLLRINNKDLTTEDHQRIKDLPNFDKDIFGEITGIDIE